MGLYKNKYYGLNQANQDRYRIPETGGYPSYDNQYQGLYDPYVQNEAGGYGSRLYGVYPPEYDNRLYGIYHTRYRPDYPSEFPQYLYGQYAATRRNVGLYGYSYGRGFNLRPWRGFKK